MACYAFQPSALLISFQWLPRALRGWSSRSSPLSSRSTSGRLRSSSKLSPRSQITAASVSVCRVHQSVQLVIHNHGCVLRDFQESSGAERIPCPPEPWVPLQVSKLRRHLKDSKLDSEETMCRLPHVVHTCTCSIFSMLHVHVHVYSIVSSTTCASPRIILSSCPLRRAPSSVRMPRLGSASAMPFEQETEDLLETARSDIQRLREREERKVCFRLCAPYSQYFLHA